jgi:hypothetical protein
MYVRNETDKHNATVFVILLTPVMFLVLIIGFIFGILGILGVLNKVRTNTGVDLIVSASLLALGIIWDCICRFYYNFYENCKLSIDGNKITYTYDLNKSIIMSNNVTTKVTIKNIRKFKFKGKSNIVFYGDIIKRTPLRKERSLNKIELPIDFTERDEIVNKLVKLSEVRVC